MLVPRLCVFVLLAVLPLSGCGLLFSDKTPQELPPANPMGLSGKMSPEAEAAYDKAKVLWRRERVANLREAEVCADPRQAVTLLTKVINLEPGYPDAYVRRGLARSQLGENEPAFDDATKGIRLDSKPEYYAYRGLISMRGKHYRGARKDLEYSLKLNSSQYQAWNFLGVLDLLEGRNADACASFSSACSAGDCLRLEAARKQGLCK